MAKRRRPVSPEVTTTNHLNTEPMNVKPEMKPAIYDTSFSVFNARTIQGENDTLFKCDGCGKSGNYLLDLGYRLVKTAMLVEVGTQTGLDEIAIDPVKVEITDPFYYDTPILTSATLPIIGKFLRE